MTAPGAAPVGELAAELRALAEVLLDRLEPWLASLGTPPEPGAVPTTCAWCPVCALAAAVRGERPELGRRLAEQGTGLLAAVRALVDEHGTHEHGPQEQSTAAPAGTTPRVQPIAVRRR